MAKEMTRRPEEEKKLKMIETLPEFIKIVHNYFIGERRAAIKYEEVIKKTVESFRVSISMVDVEERIKLLSVLLPEWICILDVSKGTFIKIIDKDKSIKELNDILTKTSEKIKQGTQ